MLDAVGVALLEEGEVGQVDAEVRDARRRHGRERLPVQGEGEPNPDPSLTLPLTLRFLEVGSLLRTFTVADGTSKKLLP